MAGVSLTPFGTFGAVSAPALSPTRPPSGRILWVAGWGRGPVPPGCAPGALPQNKPQFGSALVSIFSTHCGKKLGWRFDQPEAVAAASLID